MSGYGTVPRYLARGLVGTGVRDRHGSLGWMADTKCLGWAGIDSGGLCAGGARMGWLSYLVANGWLS